MTFDIRLIDHVHPELIAEVIEPMMIGIVRCPNRCDVVGPHRDQILSQILFRQRLSTIGVMVVPVDPEDPDRRTVHEQLSIPDFYSSTSGPGPYPVQLKTLRISHNRLYPIPHRILRRPRRDVTESKRSRDVMTCEHIGGPSLMRDLMPGAVGDHCPVYVSDCDLHGASRAR